MKWVIEQESEGISPCLEAKNQTPISLDESLIVGLRRREGVDLKSLAKAYGWDEKQCKKYLNSLYRCWTPFIQSGILKHYGNRFQLSNPEGMDLSNQVLVQVILWWENLPKSAVHQSNS